jgi:formate C-acetyltransferase
MMDWLAATYVNALNVIHYMHDKYAYERIEMALHDYATCCARWRSASPACRSWPTACPRSSTPRSGPVRDETGLIGRLRDEGDFPTFGNNDDRVDDIAVWLVETFMEKLRKHCRPTATPRTPSRC